MNMEKQFVTVFGKQIFLEGKTQNILRLSGRKITSIDQILGLDKITGLNALNLSDCTELTSLTGLPHFKSLQTLILNGCHSLKSLPKNIGSFQELGTLNLAGCRALTSLDQSIGGLQSLQRLNLRGCSGLVSLPESLGDLKQLKTLLLQNCHALTSLPESIGDLEALRRLDLNYCYSLASLPENIGNLKTLIELGLSSCHALTSLPESIGELQSLEILDLSNCYSLSSLPESLGNLQALKTLNLENCDLEEIPPMLHSLNSLESLNLEENPLSEEELGISISPIPVILDYLKKKVAIRVFLSHAEADYHSKLIKIKEISQYLESQNEVYKAYYSEQDLQGNFDEFMRKNVPNCQVLLFFATENSLESQPCRLELQLAIDNGLQIIPILGPKLDWSALNKIELSDESGYKFQLSNVKGLPYSDNFNRFSKDLYDFIYKLKRSIDLFDKELIQVDQFHLEFAEIINSYIKTQEYRSKLKSKFTEISKLYKRFKDNYIDHSEFIEKVFQKISE